MLLQKPNLQIFLAVPGWKRPVSLFIYNCI